MEKPLSHLHVSIRQELGDTLTSGSQPHILTELVSRVARPVGVLKLPGGPAVHRDENHCHRSFPKQARAQKMKQSTVQTS